MMDRGLPVRRRDAPCDGAAHAARTCREAAGSVDGSGRIPTDGLWTQRGHIKLRSARFSEESSLAAYVYMALADLRQRGR